MMKKTIRNLIVLTILIPFLSCSNDNEEINESNHLTEKLFIGKWNRLNNGYVYKDGTDKVYNYEDPNCPRSIRSINKDGTILDESYRMNDLHECELLGSSTGGWKAMPDGRIGIYKGEFDGDYGFPDITFKDNNKILRISYTTPGISPPVSYIEYIRSE